MKGKIGRPKKSDQTRDNKQAIIDAAIDIIRTGNASSVTVRNVCARSSVSIGTFYHYFKDKDDLLMYFVKDSIFPTAHIKTPPTDPAGRIVELYHVLIDTYMDLGEDFMKSFYTTDNIALSAFLGQKDGHFPEGSIMELSEIELNTAKENGYFSRIEDIHQAAADICTIVKGSVFEWCLSGGSIDLKETLNRIIRIYLER